WSLHRHYSHESGRAILSPCAPSSMLIVREGSVLLAKQNDARRRRQSNHDRRCQPRLGRSVGRLGRIETSPPCRTGGSYCTEIFTGGRNFMHSLSASCTGCLRT